VFGAAADGLGAEDVTEIGMSKPSLLVMGNEGAGLRTNVRRACTRMVGRYSLKYSQLC
jgi:21S rRNA (GM2251-2'-O)-methyltransferase